MISVTVGTVIGSMYESYQGEEVRNMYNSRYTGWY